MDALSGSYVEGELSTSEVCLWNLRCAWLRDNGVKVQCNLSESGQAGRSESAGVFFFFLWLYGWISLKSNLSEGEAGEASIREATF